MNPKTLLLPASFTSIFILLILSLTIEPNLTKINQLKQNQLDSLIKIQGQIIKIQEKNKITILTLKDSTGTIEAVLFDKTKLNKPAANQTIEAIGKLSKYNNQLQINIDKIKNVD